MLTAERVKELLSYDPETGLFRWKVGKGRRKKGNVAGCLSVHRNGKQYIRIGIDGSIHYAHRLAWILFYGTNPNEIDHKDGNGLNNRICNLADVVHAENMRNVKKRTDNTSGVTGVYWFKAKRRWIGSITHSGKTYRKYFSSKQEAIEYREYMLRELKFSEQHGT